jgi:preprotein translocase subunit SecF
MMWNAELVSMYFGKKTQNMSTYKSNHSGKDIAQEFRTHYDFERVYLGSGSPLYVQSPGTPPISQKRYLYNHSHAVTANQLVKFGKDSEFTVNALYYRDRIEKNGYSLYEQYLPGDSVFTVEERVNMLSKIHNMELVLRLNTNAENYYLNNVFNVRRSWNSDAGTGITRSSADGLNETLSQQLDKPVFAIDNTFHLIKNVKDHSYKVYFSTGYGQRVHALSVTPAGYFGDHRASSLTQDVSLRDFASVLRVSYGLRVGYFYLDYSLWGRVDIQKMDTELHVENDSRPADTVDSLRNNLQYDKYQTGFHQTYTYDNRKLRVILNLPLTYETKTADDRVPETFSHHTGWIFNPSFTARYDLTHEFQLLASSSFNKSLGDMNSYHTGLIMRGYRNLLRNTVDRLFESHSAETGASISYRNVFVQLFLNAGINYRYSWQNLLYGYDFHGIMSVKNTMDKPTISDGFGINFSGSKGLDFWPATVRFSGTYSQGRGEQLLQDNVLRHRTQGYRAGAGMNVNPFKFLGVDYSFSWSRNQSYAVEQTRRFPPITGISQDVKINFFPVKTLTVNFGTEHRYISTASTPHTVFADAGIKFKRKQMDAKISVEAGNPEISIIPDRDKMASLGVSQGSLGLALYDAFNGNTDTKFRDGNNEYDINIRLDRFDRRNIADVENFSLVNTSGDLVKLKQFAKVEETESPTQLERRNRAPSVTVSCQVAGRPSGDVGTDMEQVIADLNFPESISTDYGGDLENQDEGFGSLGTAIVISLLLVYLIMVLLYNSYVYPLVVLFSIPLAIIGAFPALALTMESLNVFTILGLLMLIGLVAKNAILVVDFTNQLYSSGMALKAALVEATRKRFRPIVMTTLAMVIGMLPVALAQGAGSAWKNGLAWVIIGGLLRSMFLPLVIVPLVYYLMDKVMMRFGRTRKKVELLSGE